jgi:hypothetical protein
MIGLRVIDPEDALRAGIHQDEVDLLGDLLISLLPGDGFKTVSCSLEGIFQAIGAV